MAAGAVALLSALGALLGTSLGNRYDLYFVPKPSSPPLEVSPPSQKQFDDQISQRIGQGNPQLSHW